MIFIFIDIPNRVCAPIDILQADVNGSSQLFNKNVTGNIWLLKLYEL